MAKKQTHLIDVDQRGTVVHWNPKRGFGFIRRHGQADIFVHVKSIEGYPASQELPLNTAVTFDVAEGERGPVAVNVRSA